MIKVKPNLHKLKGMSQGLKEPAAVLGSPEDLRCLEPLHLIGHMCVNREPGQGKKPDHVQGGDARNLASVPRG